MKPFTYKEYVYYNKILQKENGYNNFKLCEEGEKYSKEEDKVTKPHDKMFKEVLDNKEEAVCFINEVLKLKDSSNELKKEDIEKYNRAFITDEFKNMEADVIYKLKKKNIFFLIEHQSSIDYSMPYRILKYNMAIMESAIDKNKVGTKGYKLPMVYSFVIYTGDTRWNVQSYLAEKQETLKGYKEQGFANYEVIDVNNYTKEELLSSDRLLSRLMLLEKSKEEDELYDCIESIIQSNPNNEQKKFFRKVIYYIFKDKIIPEKLEEYNIKLELKKGEVGMTLKEKVDMWWYERGKDIIEKEESVAKREKVLNKKEGEIEQREGEIEQREGEIEQREGEIEQREGEIIQREEKINKEKNNIIIEMLKNHIDENMILKITKISKRELNEIKKESNLVATN